MHFSLFRKNKHSLPSESPDRSKYSPLHQQANAPIRTKPNCDPNVRPTHSTHPVGPMQNNRANFIQNSVHYAGQNDPNPGFRPSEKKQQSHPQSRNRNPRSANPGPPVLSDDQQAMFFQNDKAHSKGLLPKPSVERVNQRQPSFVQSQNSYPKSTAPEGHGENDVAGFLQSSKMFPKYSPSGQKTAYQEVHDRMLRERANDMKIIERNNAKSPQELLIWLKSENQIHMDKHKFRSGFNKIKPYMSALMSFVTFGSVFTAFESTGFASLGVGLFKSTLAVAISLCEASANMEDKIQVLISKIAMVNEYNKLAAQGQLELLHEPLVEAYETLFQFFFKVFDLLHKGLFLTRAMAESSEIASLITTFSEKCMNLCRAGETETMEMVMELIEATFGKRSKDERKIFKALGEGRQAEEDFEEAIHLKNRAQEGCEWIRSTPEFQDWFEHNRTKFLAMFGAPGSGKTTTTAYVIETLRNRQLFRDKIQEVIVCSFYCRDDEFRDKSKNMWSSLLAQIVDGRPSLQEWLLTEIEDKETQSIKPLEEKEIQDLIVKAIKDSNARVFVVLDGLDESSQESRVSISDGLEKLSKEPLVKAFLTFREGHEIMKDMPQGCGELRHRNTPKENLAIAQHHVDAKFSKSRLGPEYREQIVHAIANKAEGSPIWIQMVVENLGAKTSGELWKDLQIIDQFPTRLAEVYGKTYDKFSQIHGEAPLVPAIQALAIACRPLTMQELAVAVSYVLGKPRDQFLDTVDIYCCIRPFVKIGHTGEITVKGLQPAIVRLSHQSLKELILTQHPADWGQKTRTHFRRDSPIAPGLETMLARACITHLQGEDFGRDIYDRSSSPPHTLKKKTPPPFFEYAASFWARHFANADSQGANPLELIPASAQICRQSSARLRNWTTMFMSTSGSSFPPNPDFLVISSFFNHACSVSSILDNGRQDLQCLHLAQALYWGALRGSARCIGAILERKDFIRIADCKVNGESPLHAAARSGDRMSLDGILDSRLFDINERNQDGQTAIAIAVQKGHGNLFDDLLDDGADFNIPDDSGRTPLYTAVEKQRMEIVTKLLSESGINLLQVAGGYGNVLTISTRQNSLESTKALLNYRGPKSLLTSPQHLTIADKWRNTPLIYATMHENVPLVELILQYATKFRPVPDLYQCDLFGTNALGWAARSRNPALLSTIVSYAGARGFHNVDHLGWNPLLVAANSKNRDTVRSIIKLGVDVNSRCAAGQTAVIRAARAGSVDVLAYLSTVRGVDMAVRDHSGGSAVSIAASAGHEDVVKFLVQQCRMVSDVNVANNHGETPLALAASGGHLGVMKQLVSLGANVNAVDKEGRSVLSIAASRGQKDVVKMLLQLVDPRDGRNRVRARSAVDLDARDNTKRTALSHAAENGQVGIVQLLGKTSSRNVNTPDAWGRTPLFYAAARGKLQVVAMLLEEFRAAYTQDNDGRVPLDYAARHGWKQVVSYLKSLKAPDSEPLISLDDAPVPTMDPIWRPLEERLEESVKVSR